MSHPAALTPEQVNELSLATDLRLADVWRLVFEHGMENLNEEALGWLLRLAYTAGYQDALTESQRGELLAQLGYPVPGRADSGR